MPQLLAALGIALALASPTAAPTQDYQEQLAAQVEAIHAALGADYQYASDMHVDVLAEGGTEEIALQLDGAAHYMIVAVCDNDCSDIDLAVLDPNDNRVAADVEPDDAPVVFVEGEGDFEMWVGMAKCSTDVCYYAVQVFVRY